MVEFDCSMERKDGYYLTELIDTRKQLSFEKCYSFRGQIFKIRRIKGYDKYIPVSSTEVSQVFIDTYFEVL